MILDDVKKVLRISNTAFDIEINDLILAAKQDLIISGVIEAKANDDTDTLIKRAIMTYCKANFGWDNPDSEKLQQSYVMLKMHLTVSMDYNAYIITFNVLENTNAIEDAAITFNGETKETDILGVAVFKGVKEGVNQRYTVIKSGYTTVEIDLDVTATITVNVELAVV